MTRIMDMSSPVKLPLSLESLPHRQRATVAGIDWAGLSVPEARRLRELGFDEGVAVEVLPSFPVGTGPIACRIGRMTVALRRTVPARSMFLPLAGYMNLAPLVALVGNPNAGKSALFNALTGARQKIGNYPGVTVERQIGAAGAARRPPGRAGRPARRLQPRSRRAPTRR